MLSTQFLSRGRTKAPFCCCLGVPKNGEERREGGKEGKLSPLLLLPFYDYATANSEFSAKVFFFCAKLQKKSLQGRLGPIHKVALISPLFLRAYTLLRCCGLPSLLLSLSFLLFLHLFRTLRRARMKSKSGKVFLVPLFLGGVGWGSGLKRTHKNTPPIFCTETE